MDNLEPETVIRVLQIKIVINNSVNIWDLLEPEKNIDFSSIQIPLTIFWYVYSIHSIQLVNENKSNQ